MLLYKASAGSALQLRGTSVSGSTLDLAVGVSIDHLLISCIQSLRSTLLFGQAKCIADVAAQE